MAAASFVEGYLRRGVESGLEQKAIGSSSDAIGGYAVPEEIDEAIERPLDRQTILPMAAQILGSISAMLSEWLGPVRLEVDSDKLTELAEDRARLWELVGAASLLSEAEKRSQLGFEPELDAQ